MLVKINPLRLGGGGSFDARSNYNYLAILDNLRKFFHIVALFLIFIWQFRDVIEFRLGRHFEGHFAEI